MNDPLSWEDTYEIALELKQRFSNISIEEVSIDMIYRWTISLPQFQDDLDLVNEEILQSIYREWYEEVISNE